MRRLAGGLSDGVDVVTLDNGRLSHRILLILAGLFLFVGCEPTTSRKDASSDAPMEWSSPLAGTGICRAASD